VVERLPVHNADGMAVPLSQVADTRLVDGSTTRRPIYMMPSS
jgi:hypothetical protein